MSRIIHIPVTSVRPHNLYTYRGKRTDWWSENSIFQYDHMLMSAFHGMFFKHTRQDMGIRDDVVFFGDSGGYQILQYMSGNNTDKRIPQRIIPENVVAWQLDNCDIGMTLDIPLPRKGYDKKTYETHLAKSAKNAKVASDSVQDSGNKRFKLFNCVHGDTLADMIEWHETTSESCSFDGYSLSARKVLPLRLGFAMEYSNGKPFHILGVSNAKSMILMAYANRYTKTDVYFDSSSTSRDKINNIYYNRWQMSPNSGISLTHDTQPMPCHCPVCTMLEKFSDLRDLTFGQLLQMHNLNVLLEYVEYIDALSHRSDDFKRYAKSIDNTGRLVRDMNFLDAVHDIGLEDAYSQFYGCTDNLSEWM